MSKKKAQLPKRIAGYKVPKRLRKNSKPLIRLLRTPQAHALIAAALAAGTAALAEQSQASLAGKWTTKKAKRRAKFLAAEGHDRATEMAESLGRAIAGAIAPYLPSNLTRPTKEPTAH